MLRLLRRLLGLGEAGSRVPPAEPLDRADTAGRIEVLTRAGFSTAAEVRDSIIEDYLQPDAVSEADLRWIGDEVAAAFARKRNEEAGWPAETDVDRLAAAFTALEAAGIVALHRAGYTLSDGFVEAGEAQDFFAAQGRQMRGCVFYHGQDVEGALRDERLYLAFGGFSARDEIAVEVAIEAVAALRAQGLGATWDGDLDQRILVHPLRWQKRGPA